MTLLPTTYSQDMHLGKYDNSPSRVFFRVFVILAFLAALVVINFALARATIVIHPKIERKESAINLAIDTKTLKPDFSSGILPGRILESQGEITKNITDVSARKVEDFAKGTVRIKNIWKKDFFLQKGAQLVVGESPASNASRSDAGRPASNASPARSAASAAGWRSDAGRPEAVGTSPKNIFVLDNDTVAVAEGEVSATVTAKNKGLAGNIPPGKFYFLRMSKWNRERIWAENESNFAGGEIETKVVSAEDIARATQFAAEELGKQEIEKLKKDVPADSKLSPALTRVEILESRASVAPEAQTDNFQMFVRGKVSSIVFNENDLKGIAIEKFKAQVGVSQEIAELDEGEIKYELSDISGTDGKADVKVIVPAVLAPKLPSKILDKKSIVGYNEAALRERYAKFPEIDAIDVKFFPFWTKSVPSFEGQINFEIKTK
jgi:hypothetical protein